MHRVVGWRRSARVVVGREDLLRREGSGEGEHREVLVGKGGYFAAWHNPYLAPLVQKVECPQDCGRVWERAWKLFVVTEYRQMADVERR